MDMGLVSFPLVLVYDRSLDIFSKGIADDSDGSRQMSLGLI